MSEPVNRSTSLIFRLLKIVFLMDNKFWRYFAYGFFAVNTISVIIMVEVLLYGKPYASLFLLIFFSTIYFNLRHFKRRGN